MRYLWIFSSPPDCDWIVAAASPAGSMCVTMRCKPGSASRKACSNALACRWASSKTSDSFHLQVQLQPALGAFFVDADAVCPQSVAGGQQPDFGCDVFLAAGGGFHVHHHVGLGQNRCARCLRRRWRYRGFVRRRPSGRRPSVTSAKTSGPLRRRRTWRTSSTPGTLRTAASTFCCRPDGNTVQQIFDRFFAQLQAHPNHDGGHAQGGHGSRPLSARGGRIVRPPARL